MKENAAKIGSLCETKLVKIHMAESAYKPLGADAQVNFHQYLITGIFAIRVELLKTAC